MHDEARRIAVQPTVRSDVERRGGSGGREAGGGGGLRAVGPEQRADGRCGPTASQGTGGFTGSFRERGPRQDVGKSLPSFAACQDERQQMLIAASIWQVPVNPGRDLPGDITSRMPDGRRRRDARTQSAENAVDGSTCVAPARSRNAAPRRRIVAGAVRAGEFPPPMRAAWGRSHRPVATPVRSGRTTSRRGACAQAGDERGALLHASNSARKRAS